jgi:spore maturation protein CgeB
MMRILLAGVYQFSYYEAAAKSALESLGCEVIPFSWQKYFKPLPGRIESYMAIDGPMTRQMRQDLFRAASQPDIDVLFVWRGTHVGFEVLQKIRQVNPRCVLVSYNNDDPFSPLYRSRQASLYQRRLWTRFQQAIPYYDINFVYRSVNVPEYAAVGSLRTKILMPYFVPELNHPVTLTPAEQAQYGCDVVFAGHYEPDGREHYLRALVEAGVHTKLYGGDYWNQGVLGDLADYFGPIAPAYDEAYAKALTGASMCLCFLSRLNRDTYTRRCFEIPAMGKLLVSERTADLTQIFREDEEAVFFSSPEELVEKVQYLKRSPALVTKIAAAGQQRIYQDGHSVQGHMGRFLQEITAVQSNRWRDLRRLETSPRRLKALV